MISSVVLPSNLSYRKILDIQEKEFNKRIECRRNGCPLPEDIILFAEHAPVYTLGFHGNLSHLLLTEEELKIKKIEYLKINRGGDITYHGPGQITVYPILDLLRLRLGVKDYVWLLEQSVIDTLEVFGIRGGRIEGKTGVWIGRNSLNERKISAIGIKCSRHISMHGLALNVSSDLSGFSGIIPCGLPSPVTSVSIEAGKEIQLEEVRKVLKKNLISLLEG